MRSFNKRCTLLLLSFFLLAYILPLGARDLVIPDETRYGEIPREMIASGDWIVPHLNGLRYFEKPVLGYWVHAASLLLFGENDFAVRLPSALATGFSALLIYLLVIHASRREEDSFTAILAALIFLSCFEVFGVGNTALLDNLFAFFLTASIATFYFASEAPPGSAREKGFLLVAGLACGAAFLTKGFLALAVPILALAPYLIWQRRYHDLFRMSWLPLLTAVLVALPWSIAIHLRESDFWRFFFWNEHIRRFMGTDAQHKESFWYFLLIAPSMFMPWVVVVPAALKGIKTRLFEPDPPNRLMRLCLCWLVVPFLFFSLSSGKLLTYILPCFPPFAILMAFGLLRATKTVSRNKLFQGGVILNALLFGIILVAFLYVQSFGINGFWPFSQPWKAVMIVNGLLFFLLFCFWSFRTPKIRAKLTFLGIAPLLLFTVAHYTIPDLTIEIKTLGPFLEQQKSKIPDDAIIISDSNTIRAVCWYLKRSDVYLLGGNGELGYGAHYNDAVGRSLSTQAAAKLIQQNPNKTVLIAKTKNFSRWRDQLPQPIFQGQNGYSGSPSGYLLWQF